MELSSVFNRIHFLLELKNASGDDRIIMLEYITPGQMACIGEIARRIYHHTFPLLIRSNTISTRILVYHNMGWRWWWWVVVVVVVGGVGGWWWWWVVVVVVGGGGGGGGGGWWWWWVVLVVVGGGGGGGW